MDYIDFLKQKIDIAPKTGFEVTADEIKPDTIGGRIHKLREERGMTQKQFAAVIFTNPSAIGYWEYGKVLPSCEMIISICRTCNVSADWLLGLDKPHSGGK